MFNNMEINSNESELIIQLVEVTKEFGVNTVLHDINLRAHKGEIVVLLGPSGCGKSTTLKIIAGLEDPTKGEIYINGRLANYIPPKKRDVAMVFQNYALYPHMTVEHNIAFPLKMRHMPKNEIHKKVVWAARLLEIEEFLDKYPEQLSGGQRQRVAVGRALIRDPIAFLFDEPLSNLDALLRVQMRDELLKFHRQIKKTIIYVTHDQVEAMTMSDRIIVLKEGIIQQVGKPSEIYMKPVNTFVANFIGSPQMNLFQGNITSRGDKLEFVGPFRLSLGKRFTYSGKESDVYLGIRPENIYITRKREPDTIQGEVVLVEAVGSDTFLNVEISRGISCKVRIPATFQVRERDHVKFKIQIDKVHLFDARGVRITSTQDQVGIGSDGAIPTEG